MSTTPSSRERELAARFLALPKDRRQRFYAGLAAQGIQLSVLPVPVAPAGAEREQLSYAQERLWFLAQLDPDSTAYNMAGALRLRGTPDVAALSAALKVLVQRHESLRTRFETHGGVARARVLPQAEAEAALLQSDARAEYTRAGEAAVQAWAEREAEVVFDLATGPLLRVHLVRFAEADYGLYVCMHHIVSDGWSLRIFISEFTRCYEHFAAAGSGAPVLAPLSVQYADYAVWQRAWLEAGERDRQLEYWRTQLAGELRVLALPSDHPRPPQQSQRGAVHDFVVPVPLARELRKLAQAHGVTLFMLCLAAFKALLQRATGERDLCVGSNIASRNRIETEAVIGFFVNTQVLRTHVQPELSFTQLLAAVKQVALAAQTHQELPFEQLVDALSPERSLAHNPIFQVHYDHQGSAYDALGTLAGVQVEPIARAQRSTVFDLMLTTLEQADGSLAATFGYATDLFEPGTIARLAERLCRLIEQVVRAPETPIAQLVLAEPGEHVFADTALSDWPEARELGAKRAYVLDAALQPMAAGLAGALYWAGLAARSGSVPDPWAEQAGEHMLAAGQLARFRSDGTLEVLGQPAPAAPAVAEPRVHQAASGQLEEQLSSIFCDVLQLPEVSVTDNFFELGGDSIISIQVVSRARELGIALRPKDLFQHQTVQRLALVAKALSAQVSVEADGGDYPLTPIQQAFFARALPEPDHFNQSLLLESRAPLDSRALERALHWLVTRHAVLRSAFRDMRQYVEPVSADSKRILVTAHVADRAEIRERCEAAQRSLNIARGDVLRALHLRAAQGGSWLLLVVHHLAVDGVSWRILLEDLQHAYQAFASGGEPQGAARRSGFGAWAERLQQYARSPELTGELAHWRALSARIAPLPSDMATPLHTLTNADVARVQARLSRAETEQLLKHSGAAYRTHVHELLLAALSRALCQTFTQQEVSIWLEGHGREDVFDGLDVSRTLGWFTSEYPVVLTPAHELAQTILAVKEQLRALPQHGFGYGVLRELAPEEVSAPLRAAAKPSVAFNYLGQFDASFGPDGLFGVADESAGAEAAASTPLAHALEINGQVYAGELSLSINFSPRMYRDATVEQLRASFERELRALIAHCTSPEAGGVSPSDFPLAKLDQAQLDALVAEHGVPEAVYPVTAMQHGMLFHALYDAEPGIYVTQLAVTIENLDEARFVAAWRRALARHAILRTQFAWSGRSEPLQLVAARAELAFESHDLRELADQAERLVAVTREQHTRAFALQRAPLWRIALVRLDAHKHAFVWTHHHLLLDGWSTARLLDEVLLDYLGRMQPRPAHAFGDYVAWLARRDEHAGEQFWRERLQLLDEPTLLAGQLAGSTRPKDDAATGVQVVRTRLSAAETQALGALAQRERVTLNALVQAAWALLLQRYTAQPVVVFGATTSGRPPDLAGSEQMLGLFINTLPVIVPLQPTATVSQLWHSVQEAGVAAREHEYTPLAKLQRWAGVAPGQSALFDTLIVFENFPIDSALQGAWQELSFGRVETVEITNYALTLGVHPGAELELDYAFDPRALAPTAVQQLAAQLGAWLRAFPQLSAELPLGHLTLAGEQARQVTFGPNPPFVPMHTALLERMRARADQSETLVIGGDGEGWTAAELEQRVTALACFLRERGVGTDVRVGLYVKRGPWLIAGALAIWQAGGAYVPLDPAYPRERLEWMAGDAQLRLVLCTPGYSELSGVESVDIAHAAAGVVDQPLPAAAVHASQLAYVIYTSGSTGTPKGVGVSHGALAMHAHAIGSKYSMTEADTALQMASASFDASVEQWTTPLISGARLVLSDEQPWTGSETLAVLRRERVTVIYPPTSQLVALCQHLEQSGEAYTLRICCVGGEAVSRENIALIRRNVQPQLIINGYGPTETVITPLAWRATPDMPCETPYAPIGWTIGDRSAYVLDGELNIQPRGVAGELYLGGSGMARGYLGRAALTGERFVPDPFGSVPGARLYRTGDRVRALPDGTIEFLGRVDHQVKLRGYRIELGEIEARLLSERAVIEAVVVVRQDGGAPQLVGYASSAQPDLAQLEAALLQRLRDELPAHMAPTRLVLLPQLPHTPNGKIDRRALPAPEQRAREHKPAGSDLERELLACFAEVLGVSELGVSDDFFELGGDSLLSLQLVSRLRARGHALSLREIFALRTVEALAVHVAPARAEQAIEQVPRAPFHPLSHAQERLWFLAQLEPNSSAYNIAAALRLRGALDVNAVQRAFDVVVARHEALRTSFYELAGRGVQRIHDTVQLPVVLTDARGGGAEQRAQALFAAELSRPFDLSSAPLLRVQLIRTAETEHVLVVSVHHLVADGWSLRRMTEEFAQAYEAFARSQALQLPAQRLHYIDYADWQRQWLAQGELARQLDYWRTQLGDEQPVLALPFDHTFADRSDRRGGAVEFQLDRATSAGLVQLAQAHGASLFMVLMAAFQAVLYRWTGQGSLRVGVPLSNRSRLDTESIVGLFVNTLVMRGELHGAPTFAELLAQVKEISLAAQANQDLPFEQLVDAIAPERSLSHNPLFQVMFDHQRAGAVPALAGLQVEPFTGQARSVQFDLTLDTSESGGVISGNFAYAAALFEESTIHALAQRFTALVQAVLAQPALRLAELPLAAAEDVVLAPAAVPVPLVHTQIARSAQLRPNAIALQGERDSLTYAQLDALSNQWAQRLLALGVGPEVSVGLCAMRGPRLFAAALAIFKAGGVYVPLDPKLPRARLRELVAEAGVQVLIGERALPLTAELAAPRCLWLDDEHALQPAAAVEPALSGDNLAYIVFTSGSTGRPKGVGVSHAALAQHVHAIVDSYGLRADDCALHLAPLSVDVAVEQWLAPLSCGARLLVSGDELWSPEQLLARVREHGVSYLDASPAYLHEVARHAVAQGATLPVRVSSVGGEALSREQLKLITQALAGAPLINAYGPTEAVITPLTWRADASTECLTAYAPIGRPVGARSAYVLDADLNVLPLGATGELYLGGVCLARGYVGKPVWTAERFVPDPFATEPGCRMYRTGDLARRLADGNIEYLGRSDQQVKLRGFRIELGEVEAQLLALPGVREALVLAEGGALATRLIGYVAGEPTLDAAALRQQLRAACPEHLVPAQLVCLPALPRTVQGKVDRRQLPAAAAPASVFEAPHTPLEAQLCAIWREVLDVPQVGRTDNFFDLGGDSIRSLQVISRARSVGIALRTRDLFECRDVAELARVAELAPSSGPELVAQPRTAATFPLSFAQERLWFLAQLDPGSAAYNIAGAVRLHGAFDGARLQHAVTQLVARHEALRTTFELHDGQPQQRVHAQLEAAVDVRDLRGEPHAEDVARAYVEDVAHRSFDLERGPLLRVAMLTLSEHEHVLSLVVHHIVSDGWSLDLAIAELSQLYNGTQLPALPVQYVDYAHWQRAWGRGPELQRQLEYWKAELGGEQPVLDLPLDHPRPAEQSFRGALWKRELDPALSARLHDVARSEGVTMFMLLLATWQTLLYRLTGEPDVRVGVPVTNRSRIETEALIGLFVNTQVLRAQLRGELSFSAHLQQVKRSALGASAHRDLPFEQLVEALQPERSLGHNPLFQVTYNHASAAHTAPTPALELSELAWRARGTQFDLSLDTEELPGQRLALAFTYATDLFEPETIARMAARFERLLQQIAQTPALRIAELAVLTEAELASLSAAAGPVQPAVPPPSPYVHVCIAAQAAQRPDAIAVQGGDGAARYSYAQLEQRSNQWAQRLVRRGIVAEQRIGMCTSRSPEMVVAALAISKAGGAYVALDPSYPVSRLAALVADAGVSLILAERSQPVAAELGAVLWLDEEDVRDEPTTAPNVALSPEQLAYVIYTSGSTGKPKGVGVSHGAVSAHLAAIGADYGMRADDCALHFASFGFDASVEQWASPLMHGARVLMRGDELWTADRALTLLREHSVTWFDMPPGYAREIAQAALERGERLQLRACSASAEALSREALTAILQAVQPASLVNGYGPTEAVITPMTWHAHAPEACRTAYAPIGRVVGPRRGYVLDRDLNLVPDGVTGELYLAGCVARGYLAQPGLSAERFLPDPHASVPGERMYRTGDRVRRLPDGAIEFLGRADHQVKVRGFRVELGEIEAQLLGQPGVHEAIVVAHGGGAVTQRLIGYVVGAVDGEALRQQLRAALPEHMVPSQLLILAELPRNANGKIDRKRLPEPDAQTQDYVAPRTEVERRLSEIWREVLEVERVGVHDNFFALGGHSLLVIRVVARVRAELGCELQVRQLFETQDLAELASVISAASSAADAVEDALRELAGLSDEEIAALTDEEE
jgi:amino acid adenylation domain-containing protein/non-ribosomal peptide synthase protein (TIGR01720 family)